MNIESSLDALTKHYDALNADKSTYNSTNDEPTPIECIGEMIRTIPADFWAKDVTILDPCCGNGNFSIPIFFELKKHHSTKHILENILYFNDVNARRLDNVRSVFCANQFALQITNHDYMTHSTDQKYDLIVANPPYAKLMENGKRASKNHNLIKIFIEKALSQLKPGGYLLFLTPDNWMSYADRNVLIEQITSLQILHLDIHSAKKYFKKVGSSFTWYLIENCPFYKDIQVTGIWKQKEYCSTVLSQRRKYIPLVYNQLVQSILAKTVDSFLPKFDIKTSSDLHKYTKASLIRAEKTDVFQYKLIHTPSQTVYASRPHKFQAGYKVFLSITDKYNVFVDQCGMTQSVAFILCTSESQAKQYAEILQHPLYVFLNNICRWGNFNNIRILQHFPIPNDVSTICESFHLTEEEIAYLHL
jgi:methylase of polypeptide subunit release factors